MSVNKKKGLFLLSVPCLILVAWFCFRAPRKQQSTSLPVPNARKLTASNLREWRRQGLKSSFRRKDDVLVEVFPDVPTDQPLVEFRVSIPTKGGGLKQAKITGMQFMRACPDGLEPGDFSGGERLVGVAEVGLGYCTFVGGPDCQGRRFTFGQRYYVQYGVIDTDGKETRFENFFTVPDEIARGKIYHIDLVAKIPANTYIMQKALKESLRGKVCKLDIAPSKLQVTYVMPGDGQLTQRSINEAGEFTIGNVPLGGCLLVEDQRSAKGTQGHVYFFSRNVTKREISFPRDADLSIRASDIISFKLIIPGDIEISEVKGVGLKLKRDDPFPIAWNQLRGKTTNREIELKFVPGHYFAEIVTQGNEKELEFIVFGPIEVTAEDSDKVIRLQEKAE